ncbi:MAG: mycofactocin radical SAM maturase [Deltaproteobacteria bacterium]|nr:mycofactocin radical SAM maturase [Deltaproteobacteria bacterium]
MSAEMAKKGLRAPVNVTWEITLKCNLHCVHCLSGSGEASKDELTTSECMRLIDELSAIKVFQVNIGGGEPFIREDFLDLLDYSHKKGLVTCVSTNGTLIDNTIARRLAKMEMLYLQVSLDGVDEATNDTIRGKGTYRKIINAIETLTANNVKFSINTVLTRTNFEQLESLRDMAGKYGSELRVSRFRPSGRGKASKADLGPTAEQLEYFAAWLEGHDLVKTGDSFFCLTSDHRREKGLDMCGAAKMTCCVSPGGNVYPCAFMQEPPFYSGNVRRESIKKIWDNSLIFKQFRNINVKSCMTCYRFEVCRGGCPAMAYHTYHDINMPDPECLVNLKAGTGITL